MDRGIWIHQVNQLAERTPAEIAATLLPRGVETVYLKAADGIHAMAAIYTHALAPQGPLHLARLVEQFAAEGLRLIPWVNPRGLRGETELHVALGRAARGLVVDWEYGYEGFFEGGRAQAEAYWTELRAAGIPWLAVAPDPRQVGREYPVEMIHCDAYLPQCYWTDFERPWQEVVGQAHEALTPLGSVEPILPWNATPADLAAALEWCGNRYRAVSLWRMGAADDGALDAFAAGVPLEVVTPMATNPCEGPITGLAHVADVVLDQVQADTLGLLAECRRRYPRKAVLRAIAATIQGSVAEGRRVREQMLGGRPEE